MNPNFEIARHSFAARARRAVPLPAIICALALTPAMPAAADGLGRLFFAPEQRARLDADHARTATPADSPNVISIDGIVQRHGGARTVWINGVPQAAGQSDASAPESVPVAVPGQSQPVQVKVGEKVIVAPAPKKE
jgi:hypothetical protein